MQDMTEEERSRALDSLATSMLALESDLAALAQRNPTEARVQALIRAQRVLEDGERSLSAPSTCAARQSADVELTERAEARVRLDADLRSMAATDWQGAYRAALSRVVATPEGRALYEAASGRAPTPAPVESPAPQNRSASRPTPSTLELSAEECIYPSPTGEYSAARTHHADSEGRCVPIRL